MNASAERFLMKRDFARDTSPGLKTPSYLHSLSPETFTSDYAERKAKEVWEAEQASHTSPTGRDEDYAQMMRDFDEIFIF